MNQCIYITIFNNEKYVHMFYLLLESIFIYGNLDEKTDIFIYTSTPFMNMIKNSHLYNDKIKFETNETYDDVEKACKARLDLFNLKTTQNYNKILYLDTDILVKDDINKLFDVIKDDIMYVLEEDSLICYDDYYGGKTLFGSEINNYEDKSAFTSGILLFNNCEKIKELFENINKDMINRPHKFWCHDQPYIVYNAFKYNLFNNKILKSFAVNNDHDIHSDKVIHHFPGRVGVPYYKIDEMTKFLNSLKEFTICNIINNTKEYINIHLLPLIHICGESLEGNIFMHHNTTNYNDDNINKVKNISNLLLNKNIKNVAEIGFNSGFSALLMLLSNPSINITCYDIGNHAYILPCYAKLKHTFGDRINMVIGNSINTMQQVTNIAYDLIHIDGGHSTEVAENDIINSYRLSKKGTLIIMNDYNFNNLHELWDKYTRIYNLKRLDINMYNSPHHDIKYTIR